MKPRGPATAGIIHQARKNNRTIRVRPESKENSVTVVQAGEFRPRA